MTNKELCEEYPFLIDWNEPCDSDERTYEYTLLDDMPKGWKIAFGEQLCKEIKEALIEEGIPIEEYKVLQVKEKFGGLRWYDNAYGKVQEVISKYEDLSYKTCVGCGSKATFRSTGWVLPFCDECKKETMFINQLTDECFKPLEDRE